MRKLISIIMAVIIAATVFSMSVFAFAAEEQIQT